MSSVDQHPQGPGSVLRALVTQAHATVAAGYYHLDPKQSSAPAASARLAPAIEHAAGVGHVPVIAELKPRAPSAGALVPPGADVLGLEKRLVTYLQGGACALSVLTEPTSFGGDLQTLRIATGLGVPVLMKDIIVSTRQLDAAQHAGASSVLLIVAAFEGRARGSDLVELIDEAQRRHLEVVLECATLEEYRWAQRGPAEVLMVNNRDLHTLGVDVENTERILAAARKDRPVVSASGIEDVVTVRRLLGAGADAVLVGTALMRQRDPLPLLRSLVGARP